MAGAFAEDGPALPVEFSRVARDGRATLVIDPAAARIGTYWVRLDVTRLDEAVAALGRRERIPPERWPAWIGAQTAAHPDGARGEATEETRATIARWLAGRPLDALVWTALPPRRPDGRFAHPSADELVAHLSALSGDARARAEEYVRRAPAAVRTARRARFEAEFGWTPSAQPPNPPTPGVAEATPNAPIPEATP